MARLVWDRLSTGGVFLGVLYADTAEVWNGLKSVDTEEPDSDVNYIYQNGQRYARRVRPASFAGSITALSIPELLQENGSKFPALKNRFGNRLGFSYRSGVYLHIVYNATISRGSTEYESLSDDLEPLEFSFEFTTLPVPVPDAQPTSHLIIDTSIASVAALEYIELLLYGSETTEPKLPTPLEVIDLFRSYLALRIVDNGDGTWTAIDTNDHLRMIDDTTFEITTPSALYIDENTYTIESLI